MRGLALLIVPLLQMPSAVQADNSGLLRCRGLSDPAARLACYDALVPAAATPPAIRTPEKPATTAPAPEAPPDRFGLKTPVTETVQAVDNQIAGEFRGWQPGGRITLANGQVWEIADGSQGALAPVVDPKVRVRRGALGSYYLEVDGLNRSPRVKRIQ